MSQGALGSYAPLYWQDSENFTNIPGFIYLKLSPSLLISSFRLLKEINRQMVERGLRNPENVGLFTCLCD